MEDRHRPLFFIHVMKTGGSTVADWLRAQLDECASYPNVVDDSDRVVAYTELGYLAGLSTGRVRRTRFVAGHFPFMATSMLGVEVDSCCVLRDPVERVVSHLKQVSRNKGGWRKFTELKDQDHPSLLEVYRNDFLRERFFLNHQLKMFAFRPEDQPHSYLDPLDIDRPRFELAIRNLEQVDILGFQDDIEGLLSKLAGHLGVPLTQAPVRNVAPPSEEPSAELLEVIRADNALEIEFYDRARSLA